MKTFQLITKLVLIITLSLLSSCRSTRGNIDYYLEWELRWSSNAEFSALIISHYVTDRHQSGSATNSKDAKEIEDHFIISGAESYSNNKLRYILIELKNILGKKDFPVRVFEIGLPVKTSGCTDWSSWQLPKYADNQKENVYIDWDLQRKKKVEFLNYQDPFKFEIRYRISSWSNKKCHQKLNQDK